MVKTKPIIFTAESVRSILEGDKFQTRRVISPQPIIDQDSGYVFSGDHKHLFKNDILHQPWQEGFIKEICKYQVGDICWIREPWRPRAKSGTMKSGGKFEYEADREIMIVGQDKFRSPMFMPKEAARHYIKMEHIRIELLQDISQEDARLEGVIPAPHRPAGEGINCKQHADGSLKRDCFICSYRFTWDQINGNRGFPWVNNPFVWVYDFTRA
jgi:hypothetical protein